MSLRLYNMLKLVIDMMIDINKITPLLNHEGERQHHHETRNAMIEAISSRRRR